MRRVYAYYDLKDLKHAPFFEEIGHLPQIASSHELADCLKGMFDPEPVSASSLIRRWIAPHWRDDVDRADKTALTSEFFRENLARCSEDDRQWLMDCRRNASSMIAAVETLVECRYGPDALNAVAGRDIGLLQELWLHLSRNCGSFADFERSMESLNDRAHIDSVLTRAFGRQGVDRIVLHGFRRFTPLQEFVFNAFERSGIELIMLIHYDSIYGYANEIWRDTLSNESKCPYCHRHMLCQENPDSWKYGFCSKYPDPSEWVLFEGEKDNCIGKVFEGKPASVKKRMIRRYGSVMDLAKGVRDGVEEGFTMYAPDVRAADGLLRDLLSTDYEFGTMSSNPMGRFLLSVYGMWDDEADSLRLSTDLVGSILSSGWLASPDADPGRHPGDFARVSSYFSDCSSPEDWRDRAESLEKAYAEVYSEFGTRNGTPKGRWDRAMSDPFVNIGALSLDRDRLDAVLAGIRRVLNLASEVFPDEPMTLNRHIESLRAALERTVDPDRLKEGGTLLEEIEKRVESERNTREFRACDLGSAVAGFLGEALDSSDDKPGNELFNDLATADAACMTSSKVHLVMCDVNRLPGKPGSAPWPLSRSILDRMLEEADPVQTELTFALLHGMDCRPLINRNMFYEIMNCGKVVVSWLGYAEGKVLQPSPYIELLRSECGAGIETSSRELPKASDVERAGPAMRWNDFDITRVEGIPDDPRMEYAICPLKYLYGYVLAPFPTCVSEPETGRALSAIIGALAGVREEDVESTAERVLSMFPGIPDIEKRQIAENAKPYKDDESTVFDGIKYTDARLNVLCPDEDLREDVSYDIKHLGEPTGVMGLDLSVPNRRDGACALCQHRGHCRIAVQLIDEKRD